MNASGDVTYTPALNYNGTATVTYLVSDNDDLTSAAATIYVDVLPVNDAPIAVADVATTDEDTNLTIDITANDTDVDGTIDASSVDLDPAMNGVQNQITTPEGDWSVSETGMLSFLPTADFFGTASISYTVNDNEGLTSDASTITITINPVNDAPRPEDDTFTMEEDGTLVGNIVNNDIDIDGTIDPASVDLDPVVAGVQTEVTTVEGEWSVNPTGELTFIPVADYNGIATISYTIADNDGARSLVATVTVTVQSVNDAPVLVADTFNGIEDNVLTVNPLLTAIDVDGTIDTSSLDLDPATSAIESEIATPHGTFTANADGTITFAPAINFNGTTTISYRVSDDDGGISQPVTITFEIAPVNDPPVLTDKVITATQAFPVSGNLLQAGDADPDGTPLAVNTVPVVAPQHGTLTINVDGSFTYVSDPDFTGSDVMTMEVCDQGLPLPGLCATTTLTVEVVLNQAPVVAGKSGSVAEDNTFAGQIIGNGDHDPEGLDLVVTANKTTTPLGGKVTVNANGTFIYTPAPNFNGEDAFAIEVCDSNPVPACTSVGFTIQVEAVNDAPIVANENVTVNINTTVGLNILTNDSDPDNSELAVNTTPVVGPMHGTFLIDADGNLEYTPDMNFIGEDKIVFEVCDTGYPLPGICTTDTITITVVDLHYGEVFIPEGFSPNGDGRNDTFVIGYIGQEKIQFEVFNRWGNLLFKSDDYKNDWNGTATHGVHVGRDVPDGTYFYKIRVGKFEKARSFTIQR